MLTSAGNVKIVECPRDAMQGIGLFIPTEQKINYLNTLLKAGFDTLDCGSFVSPTAIPQLRDTSQVIPRLDLSGSDTKLLTIVANLKGAQDACAFEQITYLGFPLSLSETFQKRNTNRTISEAFKIVADIQRLCLANNKVLVVYLSMGFGNPYGDDFNESHLTAFTRRLAALGVTIICPSDTSGQGTDSSIQLVFTTLVQQFHDIEFGAHFHSHPASAKEKIETAYKAGCRRFDGALKGFGGCPMADDHLVGNIATETLTKVFRDSNISTGINEAALRIALDAATLIFPIAS